MVGGAVLLFFEDDFVCDGFFWAGRQVAVIGAIAGFGDFDADDFVLCVEGGDVLRVGSDVGTGDDHDGLVSDGGCSQVDALACSGGELVDACAGRVGVDAGVPAFVGVCHVMGAGPAHHCQRHCDQKRTQHGGPPESSLHCMTLDPGRAFVEG